MTVADVKLFCLCLLAVAATIGAYSDVQTLPAMGGRYSEGGDGKGVHGVQTLPAQLGGSVRGGKFGARDFVRGIPPRTPQVQPKPGRYDGIPANNLTSIGRPVGSSTRPFDRPLDTGTLTRPFPRPSEGGQRYRRSGDYLDNDEQSNEDEEDYPSQANEVPEDYEEYMHNSD